MPDLFVYLWTNTVLVQFCYNLFDRIYNRSKFISLIPWVSGWPTKMSLFLFGNSCYKSKESFKIFSPQILKVYRILLVKTTLESIIFYYTFLVINTMFVPCTVWQHSSNSNIKIVHNSIKHFLWNLSDFFSDSWILQA